MTKLCNTIAIGLKSYVMYRQSPVISNLLIIIFNTLRILLTNFYHHTKQVFLGNLSILIQVSIDWLELAKTKYDCCTAVYIQL